MTLIYISIATVFILQYCNRNYILKNKKKVVCIIVFIFLAFISSCKSIDYSPVGDLINYRNSYNNLDLYSYSDIWSQVQAGSRKDFGFYVFAKFFADIGVSPEIWMAIIAIIFATMFSWFCYKYSKDIFISYLMLIVLTFSFTLSGLRQTMALSIIFIAYHFIIQKCPIRFVITVILASLFHSSAILFLPAYWFAKMKVGKRSFIILTVFILFSVFGASVFRDMISFFAWNEQTDYYASREISLSWNGFLIQLAIFIFCYFFRKLNNLSDLERQTSIDMILNCLLLGLLFQGLATTVAESFRIAYYYNICAGIAVSNTIVEIKNIKEKSISYFSIILILILYMIITGSYSNLVFIWQ